MRYLFPILGFGVLCFAAVGLFLFKQWLDDYNFANSLQSVELAAPAGWETQPYQTAHGEAIAGARFDPAPSAKTTTNDILFAFEKTRLATADGRTITFLKGDEKMALRLQIAPFVPRQTTLFEQMGYVTDAPEEAPEGEVFGSKDAVAFTIAPRVSLTDGSGVPVPVNYRHVTATIGDPEIEATMDIAILTSSSDAALARLIAGMDIAALNARLPKESDSVLAGLGFVARQSGPLSETPPPPTPAYRAAVMLDKNQDLDALNRTIVTQISRAEIADMETLMKTYPKLDAIRFDVLGLLGDGNDSNTARYYAQVMAKSGRAWNIYESYVLSQVGKSGTSRESLAEYLALGHDIAPEVLALVARLPEKSTINLDVDGSSPPATPDVLRGGSNAQTCRLENGVRRCVVGGN